MSSITNITREMRAQTICLAIIVAFLVFAAVRFLQPVLLPFVLAILIVAGLNPVLIGIQARFQTTRLFAFAITTVMGLVFIFLVWTIIWFSIAQLANDAPKYQQRIQDIVSMSESMIPSLTSTSNGSTDEESTAETPATSTNEAERAQWLDNFVRQTLFYISDQLRHMLTAGTVVIIFVFFLLLGSSEAAPQTKTWREIDEKIREYLVSKTLISFFTGLAFGFTLWLFGIPLSLVFGILAFLFNFIPNIGPIIASLLPLPLIMLDPSLSIVGMLAVIVLTSGIQIISGNVIEPKMMGDSFDVHPIAILLTLMFWGLIWGMMGMFIATPLTAVMKILFEKFEMTKPLADLLAGRVDGFLDKFNEYLAATTEPFSATKEEA